MQYYRCKCGGQEAWSSMGVPRCTKCEKCGSNLAQHPDMHVEPAAHDFSFDTRRDGRHSRRCVYCWRSEEECATKERKRSGMGFLFDPDKD